MTTFWGMANEVCWAFQKIVNMAWSGDKHAHSPSWCTSIWLNQLRGYQDKTQVQFLRLGTLGSPIEFKHMIALTNETQIMLSFSRIFKFNVFEFN